MKYRCQFALWLIFICLHSTQVVFGESEQYIKTSDIMLTVFIAFVIVVVATFLTQGLRGFYVLIIISLGLISTLVGLHILNVVVSEIWADRKIMSWPATTGNVIESSIESLKSQRGEGSSFVYRPNIKYEYHVGNEDYTSTGVFYKTTYVGSHDSVAKIVASYPEGEPTTVFYNPESPQSAVLKTKGYWQGYWQENFPFFLGGLIFLSVGVLVITNPKTLAAKFANRDNY